MRWNDWPLLRSPHKQPTIQVVVFSLISYQPNQIQNKRQAIYLNRCYCPQRCGLSIFEMLRKMWSPYVKSIDQFPWWRHYMETFFPRYWPFVRGIHRSPEHSPVASDAEVWCFLWPAHEQTVEQKIERLVIWDAIALIIALLWCQYSLNMLSSDNLSVLLYQCQISEWLGQWQVKISRFKYFASAWYEMSSRISKRHHIKIW